MAVRRPRKTLIESCYAFRARDLRGVIAAALRAARPWLPASQPRPSQEDDQQSAQPPALTTRGRQVRVRRADDGSSALVSVSAAARGDGQSVVVAVSYLVRDDATLRTEVAELVPLAQHFGGVRWMFRCRGCSQRSRVLYLPPGGTRFACRRCHGLTWRSVQRPVEARFRELCKTLVNFTGDLSRSNLARQLEAATAVELLVEQALGASSGR